MNSNISNIARGTTTSSLKQCFSAVCIVLCVLTMCFELVHAGSCSEKHPNGTCPAGKTCLLHDKTYGCYGACSHSRFGSCLAGQNCLLNGTKYACYGRCTKNHFGSCSKNGICLVSLIRISKNLKKTPLYACFTCTDSNPLGTCPAGQSCFTCNGSSTCVADDFVCKKQASKVLSVANLVTTTKAAAITTSTATVGATTKAAATTTSAATVGTATKAAAITTSTATVGSTTKAAAITTSTATVGTTTKTAATTTTRAK